MISWFSGDDKDGTALPIAMPRFVILMLALSVFVAVVLLISSGSVLLAVCAAAATAVVMQVVYFALIVRYVAARRLETKAETPPLLKQEPATKYELSPKGPVQ